MAKSRALDAVLPPLIPLLVLVAAAELIVREGVVKSYLLPAPSAVLRAILENRQELSQAMLKTSTGAFIGGEGLGSVVDVARTQQRVDKVFAAVLLASFLGLALFALINLASALTLRRWHASEQDKRS